MNNCSGCGFLWADLDSEGYPITLEYCHYEGPAEWAPCAQDNLNDIEVEDLYDYDVNYDSSDVEYEREY